MIAKYCEGYRIEIRVGLTLLKGLSYADLLNMTLDVEAIFSLGGTTDVKSETIGTRFMQKQKWEGYQKGSSSSNPENQKKPW